MGTMVPLSSATLMKWAGSRMPWSGWFQRTSASAPTMRAVGQGDQRLVVDLDLAAVDDVVQCRVEVEPAERADAHPVDVEQGELAAAAALLGPVHGHVGIVQQIVAGLAVLAQRDADAHGGHHLVPGAERDRVAERLEDGVGHLAGVVGRGDPLEEDRRTRRRRSGTACRRAGPRGAGGPPMTRSSSSPTWWPRLSLTTLKRSMSQKSTATWLPVRSACSSAWSRWSRRSRRLASPVSASWNAWRASCSSNALRSEVSRNTMTAPGGRRAAHHRATRSWSPGSATRRAARSGCRSW